MGFEPTRAEHIGLAVQRLNHSATSSLEFHSLLNIYKLLVIGHLTPLDSVFRLFG